MRKLLILAILGWAAWQFFVRSGLGGLSDGSSMEAGYTAGSVQRSGLFPTDGPASRAEYRCDGRTYCSQMTSCAEAKYFLKNCPGVKMDGSGPGRGGPGDGVPCEKQWCTNG